MSMLEVNGLTVSYDNIAIVDNISFCLSENEWLMMVGPNGAGKSTAVNAISRAIKYEGEVLLDGENTAKIKQQQFARRVGVLSQYHYVSYAFSVREVVALGRYAYSKGLFTANRDEEGEEHIEEALEITGMKRFADKSVLTLSGGELQRAFLAQIFAQDPKLLILDEPTNHLDLIYQQQIFELIEKWVKRPGKAVISVVHDLSLARAFGTKALLMKDGKIVSSGKTNDVLTKERLKSVYAIDVYDWMGRMLRQWK